MSKATPIILHTKLREHQYDDDYEGKKKKKKKKTCELCVVSIYKLTNRGLRQDVSDICTQASDQVPSPRTRDTM